MVQKKYGFLLLVIFFLMMFNGCMQPVYKQDNTSSEKKLSSDVVDPPDKDPSLNSTDSSQINSSENTSDREVLSFHIAYTPSISEDESRFIDDIALISWCDSASPETSNIGFINTKGEIYCKLPDGYGYYGGTGGYSLDGYFYANGTTDNTKGRFILGDMNGKILYESPANKEYTVRAGGDGIFLVEERVINITENTSKYGLINTDGTWLMKPVDIDEKIESEHTAYEYRDEKIFSIDNRILLSAETGAVIKIENADDIFDKTRISSDFCNGAALGSVGSHGDLCLIQSDGTMKNFPATISNWLDTMSSDGMFFVWHGYNQEGHFSIYDLNGQLLLDSSEVYSDYTFWKSNFTYNGGYVFHDGYAPVLIRGADGKTYITAINKETMRFSFDPICVSLIYKEISGHSALVCLENQNPALIDLSNGNIRTLNSSISPVFSEPDEIVTEVGDAYLYEGLIITYDRESGEERLYDWAGKPVVPKITF